LIAAYMRHISTVLRAGPEITSVMSSKHSVDGNNSDNPLRLDRAWQDPGNDAMHVGNGTSDAVVAALVVLDPGHNKFAAKHVTIGAPLESWLMSVVKHEPAPVGIAVKVLARSAWQEARPARSSAPDRDARSVQDWGRAGMQTGSPVLRAELAVVEVVEIGHRRAVWMQLRMLAPTVVEEIGVVRQVSV
jgi:hypothetical protein